MTIKGILLTGAALCTIAMAPAIAATAPRIAVAAAHPSVGHVKFKTPTHSRTTSHITETASVVTGVSASADYKVKTPLGGTFYLWHTGSSLCGEIPGEKIKASPKKTAYAKISTGTETNTTYCGAPIYFYGDVYELTSKTAAGSADFLTSALTAKVKLGSTKYDLDLNLDVTVEIGS